MKISNDMNMDDMDHSQTDMEDMDHSQMNMDDMDHSQMNMDDMDHNTQKGDPGMDMPDDQPESSMTNHGNHNND